MKKESINWDEVYVGYAVVIEQEVTKLYDQYTSFGNIENFVKVIRNVELFTHDGDGFILLKTNEKVSDYSYASSFSSDSVPGAHGKEKTKGYGYFMPLKDFIAQNLNKNLNVENLFLANKIIKLTSLLKPNEVILSKDQEKAMEELKTIGIDPSKINFINNENRKIKL